MWIKITTEAGTEWCRVDDGRLDRGYLGTDELSDVQLLIKSDAEMLDTLTYMIRSHPDGLDCLSKDKQ